MLESSFSHFADYFHTSELFIHKNQELIPSFSECKIFSLAWLVFATSLSIFGSHSLGWLVSGSSIAEAGPLSMT